MQRLIRRKLSRVLGGQAQVISLKEIKRKGSGRATAKWMDDWPSSVSFAGGVSWWCSLF